MHFKFCSFQCIVRAPAVLMLDWTFSVDIIKLKFFHKFKSQYFVQYLLTNALSKASSKLTEICQEWYKSCSCFCTDCTGQVCPESPSAWSSDNQPQRRSHPAKFINYLSLKLCISLRVQMQYI